MAERVEDLPRWGDTALNFAVIAAHRCSAEMLGPTGTTAHLPAGGPEEDKDETSQKLNLIGWQTNPPLVPPQAKSRLPVKASFPPAPSPQEIRHIRHVALQQIRSCAARTQALCS
jgi:hypothetical protein